MKPEVMIVGTYHLGSTPDLISVEHDNDRDVKLQAEEVVNALSRFNPTKLAVEADCEMQSMVNESYRKYRLGELTPTENEIEIIGFPLANKSGINEVSCVDWRGDDSESAPIGDILQYAKEHEPERYKKLMTAYLEPMQREAEEWSKLSVLEGYERVNEAEIVKMLHQFYMEFAMIGKGKNYYCNGLVNLVVQAKLDFIYEY